MQTKGMQLVIGFLVLALLMLAGCGDGGSNPRGDDGGGGDPGIEVAGAGAYDVWTKVWCPDAPNSGQGFHRIESFEELPNDPLGDGENNCYMEAFDTSVFTTNGTPLDSCSELDPSAFPDHACVEVRDGEGFRQALAAAGKHVVLVLNDLEVTHVPYIAGAQESKVVIGAYDPETRRPVLITTPPGTGQLINWSATADPHALTVINLRLHTSNQCFSVGRRLVQGTYTFQSVTAKCKGRFIMGSYETPGSEAWSAGPDYPDSVPDLTAWPIDDRIYFRNVMARGTGSHTVYLDRSYLNWVEDSILLPSFTSGKHAGKFIGQNVYVHNSIVANTGIHNQPIVDPEFSDQPRSSNLAAFSLAACSRVVLDHVTIPYHYDPAEANGRAVQWQIRDGLGGACDLPWSYYPNLYPTVSYRGPAEWNGHRYPVTPFWDPAWWAGIDTSDPLDPNMITSFIVSNHIHLTTVDDDRYPPYLYAIGSVGTYPTTRDSKGSAHGMYPPDEVPAGWKERQRVVVNNNCFDDGYPEGHVAQNYVAPGMEDPDDPSRHRYDNTDKFVLVGSNRCGDVDVAADWVRRARDAFLNTLPPPPWREWK